MSSSSLHVNFKPQSFHVSPKSPFHNKPILHFFSHFPLSKSHATLARASDHDREEARWLREDRRWLREEQRWLREESRWLAEREALLREISALKLKIEELQRREGSVPSAATLLPILNQVAEIGPVSTVPLVLEAAAGEREKGEVVNEVFGKVKKRGIIRKGSEGDDVRAMQEALQKLGFYCGEEDMEFSSFDSGTERAVKTWQASVGAPEDGIMTAELQERLYTERQEGANGAAVASVTEISEIQHKIVQDKSDAHIEVSQNRVFLLGENRWEDPSRLVGGKNADGGTKSKGSTTKCLSCRGEGRLLCTECDGSGEPNIEPQFLEWVGEDMKCPYCQGLGFTTCDGCDGKGETTV